MHETRAQNVHETAGARWPHILTPNTKVALGWVHQFNRDNVCTLLNATAVQIKLAHKAARRDAPVNKQDACGRQPQSRRLKDGQTVVLTRQVLGGQDALTLQGPSTQNLNQGTLTAHQPTTLHRQQLDSGCLHGCITCEVNSINGVNTRQLRKARGGKCQHHCCLRDSQAVAKMTHSNFINFRDKVDV